MEIRIIEEAGHAAAVTGLRFSKQVECPLSDIIEAVGVDTISTRALAKMDGGHNKFLESMIVWFDMRAPLYFWKQFDTYRVGITKNSKSTMHTLMKSDLGTPDFVELVDTDTVWKIKDYVAEGRFHQAIANLPDGYLQTRRICCSYKTIRHIVLQRRGHKLGEWATFCTYMKDNLKYPRLLGGV